MDDGVELFRGGLGVCHQRHLHRREGDDHLHVDEHDHRQRRPQFREPLLTRNLALVEKLKEIGARLGFKHLSTEEDEEKLGHDL